MSQRLDFVKGHSYKFDFTSPSDALNLGDFSDDQIREAWRIGLAHVTQLEGVFRIEEARGGSVGFFGQFSPVKASVTISYHADFLAEDTLTVWSTVQNFLPGPVAHFNWWTLDSVTDVTVNPIDKIAGFSFDPIMGLIIAVVIGLLIFLIVRGGHAVRGLRVQSPIRLQRPFVRGK